MAYHKHVPTMDTVEKVFTDYINADYPAFPESNDFVDRMVVLGFTVSEAIEELTAVWIETTEYPEDVLNS